DPAVPPGQVLVASAAPVNRADPAWLPQFLLESPNLGHARSGRHNPTAGADARPGSSVSRARLGLLGGGDATWAVTRLPFSIGRAAENDLTLADVRVSRRHACITLEEGSFVLRDEGSRNGTQLNGAAVHSAVLHSGDRIGICGVEVVFVVEAE
ncbi:MAG: FHA domain-containing protein, partial [Chloroflexota bacterium]